MFLLEVELRRERRGLRVEVYVRVIEWGSQSESSWSGRGGKWRNFQTCVCVCVICVWCEYVCGVNMCVWRMCVVYVTDMWYEYVVWMCVVCMYVVYVVYGMSMCECCVYVV